MLGAKPKSIAEHEADPVTDQIYHDIRQTLRVTGVNLNFRTWAGFKKFFPRIWEALRPCAETRAFEEAADLVRREAVLQAGAFHRLDAVSGRNYGASRSYQIQAALDLYHYINPKLLLLTSGLRLALEHERAGTDPPLGVEPERIERGAPPRMAAMEMITEAMEDKRVRILFRDIQNTLDIEELHSDYRTLALWPDYLERAWERFKPICQSAAFASAACALRERARLWTARLSPAIILPGFDSDETRDELEKLLETTRRFEEALPGLILNVALFQLDWKTPDRLMQSPFPAATRDLSPSMAA